MPLLSSFFAIYTHGRTSPRADVGVPRGVELSLTQLDEVVMPDTSLFGPHAAEMARYRPHAVYLLALVRDTKGSAGSFFADCQQILAEAVEGLEGWGLDVLRMYPFPLSGARDLPEDPFAEDLISVGFHEQGDHGFRAETFGLSKLGQREISFTFKGGELLEDAAILCSHLADYAMSQGRRVENKQTMSFGFDKLLFLAAEGEHYNGTFRGWHPPFMSRLLPERLFTGVGALKVMGYARPTAPPQLDLTPVLHRALEQRLVLEEYDLTGESPHQSATARMCSCITGILGLRAERKEPQSQKESGWSFTCGKEHQPSELQNRTLEEAALKVPEIMKYLALPPGCVLKFNEQGVHVDTHRARRDEPDELGD
ncbi:MAG: hypothetical protein JNK82_23400 [Myxococcaceae bacterium]|nr:hypothetical protein [Myxococcaceae bacterium]